MMVSAKSSVLPTGGGHLVVVATDVGLVERGIEDDAVVIDVYFRAPYVAF